MLLLILLLLLLLRRPLLGRRRRRGRCLREVTAEEAEAVGALTQSFKMCRARGTVRGPGVKKLSVFSSGSRDGFKAA